MQKKENVQNTNTAAEKLERALQVFESSMNAIKAERETLEKRMYEREHELDHEWQNAVIAPGALNYNFDDFVSGVVCVPTTDKSAWHKQRHAIMAALSANPFEDVERAELAAAQLDEISAAAAETDSEIAADIVKAQREMKAAQQRYLAAVQAQKNFRREIISRVRNAYNDCATSCKDAGAVWGGYRAEGLDAPHTSAILGEVSSHSSIAQAMDTMKNEINHHAEQAVKSRAVPERVEYIEAPHFRESIASPSDLAQIGANYHNNSGLRGWLGGMLGK